jgi:hypothetical protein
MAFYLTHARPTPDGGWVFADETKVRLAGADGPLARHILGLPADSTGAWSLSAAEIAAMLRVAPPSDHEQPLLLWDSGEPDASPQRVVHFSGVSREFETELLVHMEVLEPASSYLRGTGRITNEALRLTGGRLTPKARWVWCAPKMSIGSAIIGPASKGGS